MFLLQLRALLRHALVVAVVTVPAHLLSQSALARVRHAADAVLCLSSFTGLGTDPPAGFSGFDGLLSVRKLPAVNALASVLPESVQFAFTVCAL